MRGSMQLTDSVLHGCGIVSISNVKGMRLTVTGSPYEGITTNDRVILKESSVTGSTRADVASGKRPSLSDSTCGTSAVVDGGIFPPSGAPSWHVCANDAP